MIAIAFDLGSCLRAKIRNEHTVLRINTKAHIKIRLVIGNWLVSLPVSNIAIFGGNLKPERQCYLHTLSYPSHLMYAQNISQMKMPRNVEESALLCYNNKIPQGCGKNFLITQYTLYRQRREGRWKGNEICITCRSMQFYRDFNEIREKQTLPLYAMKMPNPSEVDMKCAKSA